VSAVSVRCPKCGAEPLHRCVTSSGLRALKPHHKRGNAWAEAVAFERQAERIVATFNAMSTDERADMIRELTEGDQPCGS
jgi:hypothetical protein